MANRVVKVYPRYERFWHWAQMLLIVFLAITGFSLNGALGLIPFKAAVMLHTITALVLMALWIFTGFWMITTGTWRQFVPTTEGMLRVARFYAYGVFRGEQHPHRKMYWRKHNPLQVITYFALTVLVFPAMWITGLLYMSYNFWEPVPDSAFWLEIVANLHLLVAYGILSFLVLHLYLLTIGHSFRAHVKPMLSGFEEIDLTPEQEAYLEKNEPWRLKG